MPRENDIPSLSLDERNYCAERACKIVRKFPQIEQHVIDPALTISIGHALIDAMLMIREKDGKKLRD